VRVDGEGVRGDGMFRLGCGIPLVPQVCHSKDYGVGDGGVGVKMLVRSICDSRACLQGVLQHVAACCSVLQHVAACCSVLQCVAVCW